MVVLFLIRRMCGWVIRGCLSIVIDVFFKFGFNDYIFG